MSDHLSDTDRLESALDAVVEREEQLSAIIQTALDAVVGMDAEGLITSWNPRAEQIFGWSVDEVMGKQVSDVIIPPRYRKRHAEGIRREDLREVRSDRGQTGR